MEHTAYDAEPFQLVPGTVRQLRPADGALPLFGIVGGAIDSTGATVVADGGNYRLVRWSADGRPLGAIGAQGSGPGEFENISWLHPVGRDLALYDARSRRISWFRPEEGFVTSHPFSLERAEPPSPDAIVASGVPLGIAIPGQFVAYPTAHADPDGEAGPLPLYGDLQVFDSTGVALARVGRFMLLEWYEDPSIEGFPLANRMETPRMHWAGRDNLIAIADAVAHRIDILKDGLRAAVILESRDRMPFTPDSVPNEYHLAADSLQAYRDVRIDAEHRVWVQPAVGERQPLTRWRVFSERGTRLGDLPVPSDATVLDATEQTILLLRRSELDEESVELWDLRAPAS